MVKKVSSATSASVKGGTLIEYEDEDPRVRADFEAELAKKGIKCTMPSVSYR